jgi:hypothetical protein
MDPIQPIGPRPPWIAELAAEQTQSLSRERRRTSGGSERKPGPRREPSREEHGPEDDGPEGRHIDVRA